MIESIVFSRLPDNPCGSAKVTGLCFCLAKAPDFIRGFFNGRRQATKDSMSADNPREQRVKSAKVALSYSGSPICFGACHSQWGCGRNEPSGSAESSTAAKCHALAE